MFPLFFKKGSMNYFCALLPTSLAATDPLLGLICCPVLFEVTCSHKKLPDTTKKTAQKGFAHILS